MDKKTGELLAFFPLPENISVADAGAIMGGNAWTNYFRLLVKDGNFSSITHSPDDFCVEQLNHDTETRKILPKINHDTSNESIFIWLEDVLYRWCVEYVITRDKLPIDSLPDIALIEQKLAEIMRVSNETGINRSNAKKLTNEQEAEIVRLYNKAHGMSVASLAVRFVVSRPTIDKALKKAGVKV